MDRKIDFTYLSEEDMVKAGVTDMGKCIEVMNETFELLGKGDYLMGGQNRNSHGVEMFFYKESPFPNMPIAGPDRRFLALIAYLGGRFNVCGEKWYGSNIANREKGLPRSILTVMLNNADTGAPIALMSANLVSSMRTGAVPGLAAKYLAKSNAQSIGIVGAGVMGKTSLIALLHTCKNVKTVKIYDIFNEASIKLAGRILKEFEVEVCPVRSIEDAVRGSDVICVATSGSEEPEVKEEWLNDGVLMILPAGIKISKDFVMKTKIVADNWKMFKAWDYEQKGLPLTNAEKFGAAAGYAMDLINEGKMSDDQVLNLGDIVIGKIQGRKSDNEKIIFVLGGMAVEDVAWGYTIYENAIKMDLGTKLNLWNEPYNL